MLDGLQPIKNESLKEVCIRRFEELILSGALAVGERLPPERDLAKRLGVSRPVVHEALVDIAAKGLVSLTPRIGATVNDFCRQGSIALLTSLLEYHQGKLDPKLLDGMLNMRLLMETENARLAARHRTESQLKEFDALLEQERQANHTELDTITQLDFEFHLLIAIATDNLLYPLLLNSFKPVYTNLTRQFFKDCSVVPWVFECHHQLVSAIRLQEEQKAMGIMRRLLKHGEKRLKEMISQ